MKEISVEAFSLPTIKNVVVINNIECSIASATCHSHTRAYFTAKLQSPFLKEGERVYVKGLVGRSSVEVDGELHFIKTPRHDQPRPARCVNHDDILTGYYVVSAVFTDRDQLFARFERNKYDQLIPSTTYQDKVDPDWRYRNI